MTTEQYIRTAANKYGWKKYYALERPVSLGTAPKSGMMDFINYDNKTEIQTNNGLIRAWAEIYYNRELTEEETKNYELVREGKKMVTEEMKNLLEQIGDLCSQASEEVVDNEETKEILNICDTLQDLIVDFLVGGK